jgi:hypothetical protein
MSVGVGVDNNKTFTNKAKKLTRRENINAILTQDWYGMPGTPTCKWCHDHWMGAGEVSIFLVFLLPKRIK